MNRIDVVLAVVLALFALRGFQRGFSREIFSLIGLVGGVVVGPRASELIHPVSVAVAESLPADQLAQAFTVYPSMSGSLAEAAPGLASLWREVAGDLADHERFDALLQLTMHMARGMALQKILRSDDTARRRLQRLWREMAGHALRGSTV